MAMFTRIRDILTASLNDLVEQDRDPEQLITRMIREMDQSIAELRKAAGTAITARNVTRRRIARGTAERTRLQAQAEHAVRAGAEAAARRALAERRRVDALLEAYHTALQDEEALADRLKTELHAVEEKAQEARRKRDTLQAKRRATDLRRRMQEQWPGGTAGAAHAPHRLIEDFDALADAYAEDVDEDAARADAEDELRGDAARGPSGPADPLDAELDALKRRLKE